MTGPGALRVEAAGPQALLQDAGRFGVRHLGITQGGAHGLACRRLGECPAGQ